MKHAQLLTTPAQSPDSKMVNVFVYFSVGSMRDTDNKLGTAHFLEHLMYAEMVDELKKAGMSYIIDTVQAFTYRNGMEFSLSFLKEDGELAERCIERLYDLPNVPAETFENERSILMRELADEEADPDFESGRAEAEWVYKNPLIQRRNGGSTETMKRIVFEDVKRLHTECVQKAKSLVVISNNWNMKESLLPFDGEKIYSGIDDVVAIHKYNRLQVSQRDGDPTVLVKVFGRVTNVHENLGVYLIMSYLDDQLRKAFDDTGLAYYYGNDKVHLGDTCEITLNASVAPADLERAEAACTMILLSLSTMTQGDFEGLRTQAVKSFEMASSSQSVEVEQVAYSAAMWGCTDFRGATRDFYKYPYADFQTVVRSFDIPTGLQVILRKPSADK